MSSIGNRVGRAGSAARCGRRSGELETWKPGNLEVWESARRGAGRVDRARWCSGVPASGALARRPWAPPWGGGARPSRREESEFGGRACLRRISGQAATGN